MHVADALTLAMHIDSSNMKVVSYGIHVLSALKRLAHKWCQHDGEPEAQAARLIWKHADCASLRMSDPYSAIAWADRVIR